MRRSTGEKAVPVRVLAGVLAGLKDGNSAGQFLEALLTPSERARIDLRWRLVCMLASGMPQREISKNLGISLCKITRGSRELKSRPVFRKIVVKYCKKIKRKEKT